jgi:hypothetical protein
MTSGCLYASSEVDRMRETIDSRSFDSLISIGVRVAEGEDLEGRL